MADSMPTIRLRDFPSIRQQSGYYPVVDRAAAALQISALFQQISWHHASGLSSQARPGRRSGVKTAGRVALRVSGTGPVLRPLARGAARREWSTDERGIIRAVSARAASP